MAQGNTCSVNNKQYRAFPFELTEAKPFFTYSSSRPSPAKGSFSHFPLIFLSREFFSPFVRPTRTLLPYLYKETAYYGNIKWISAALCFPAKIFHMKKVLNHSCIQIANRIRGVITNIFPVGERFAKSCKDALKLSTGIVIVSALFLYRIT